MSEAPAVVPEQNGAPVDTKPEEAGFKVFAGNLAYSTTGLGLQAFFAPVESEILTAQVIQRGTRSAGYGFVALKSAEAAQKAVDLLNKKELDGREVIVEIAKPAEEKDKEKKEKKAKRRPGRRGSKAVPGEVSEAEANGETKPDGEAGTDSTKPKKKKKKSKAAKAKAKAEETVEGATAAVEGAVAPKKKAKKPKAQKPKRPAGEDPVGEPSQTVLFVANLGFSIDDAGLSALFTEANIPVNSARIVRRRWGHPRKSKGYGFVDVGGEEQQKKAIEALQGKEVGGRPIAVKIAVNTPNDDEEGEPKADAAASEAQPTPAAAAPAATA